MAKDFTMGWDVESLNKAYQQGYMAGLMSIARQRCPYHGEVIAAAWEAGWEDGFNTAVEKSGLQKSA